MTFETPRMLVSQERNSSDRTKFDLRGPIGSLSNERADTANHSVGAYPPGGSAGRSTVAPDYQLAGPYSRIGGGSGGRCGDGYDGRATSLATGEGEDPHVRC